MQKIEFEIINPFLEVEWDKTVTSFSGGTIFHSSHWIRLLCDTYNYIPLCFRALNSGELSSILCGVEVASRLTGKRWVSLPFTDWCSPLVNEDQSFKSLLHYAIETGLQNSWKYLEIRGGHPDLESFINSNYYYHHLLDLSHDEKELYSNLRNNTKRNIKKAVKEEIKVGFNNTLEYVEHFYNLNCVTRKKHGLPPQPVSFFKKLHEHIIDKKLGAIALATYKNKIIAGAVFLGYNNKAVYKYGASLNEFQNLRANNLIMWEGIKFYREKGYTEFSFGRTEVVNEGLRRFKNGWGVTEETINYYKYDLSKNTFVKEADKLHGLHNYFFNKVPLNISRKIGEILYRHMG